MKNSMALLFMAISLTSYAMKKIEKKIRKSNNGITITIPVAKIMSKKPGLLVTIPAARIITLKALNKK